LRLGGHGQRDVDPAGAVETPSAASAADMRATLADDARCEKKHEECEREPRGAGGDHGSMGITGGAI
jgi:hypothetical protein